ncbi:DapH/DapD/GlmU-related protein [Thalassotalea aquiviva]|uniref:acyltransferase n=1 Tax=Thalassotalea aquiviva TaxID=3242415 RepID=UPI00352B3794
MINKFFKYAFIRVYGVKAYATRLGVKVGKRGRIYITDWGTEPYLITIGDDVTITQGVRLLTHDGSTELVKNLNGDRYYRYGKIVIGNNVFIGMNSIILPGISIGDNVIVGTGSVVTKDLDSNSVYAGNPAKKITEITTYSEKIRSNCCTMSDLVGDTKRQKVLDYINRY